MSGPLYGEPGFFPLETIARPTTHQNRGNGDVYTTTYNLAVQAILKIDDACSATEAVLLRAPIFLYAFWKRRGL
jgi:hypothetical protein